MAEKIYQDSAYRFTDPIRFFKANDPYYFEVDNIPLKQLQENCLWLKDQIKKETQNKISSVKRADIDELRPYATGSDRVVRVKPGRYSARINDASTRTPLAYLRKAMGEALGDVDAWEAALPNPGNFPNGKNEILQDALDSFKSILAQDAIGMNGLAERAFTWPVVNSDTPVDGDGADAPDNSSYFRYGDYDVNYPGGGASVVPFVITQALLWAKAIGSSAGSIALPTFETTNIENGWAKLPRTENFFIKAWRGVGRIAIVDGEDELSIEVPNFDSNDFSYTDDDGTETPVAGVQQRIDLVFIYSKPVDMSGVNIIDSNGKQKITKPTLGIVRGAGIKVNLRETQNFTTDYLVPTNNSILAHPADQNNDNMGFSYTSSNDIPYDIRGSFPSPDDLLNLAPLISEKLEDNAFELVGQSILPVAYVFVAESSQVILSTDVIDIRPFFRTAELTYNERAGIAGAFPQLSLANPAVGKAQLDYEIKRSYENLNNKVEELRNTAGDPQTGMNTLATGYVFGGWNFGPEGAMYDFYKRQFAADDDEETLDSDSYVKTYIATKYGIGSAAAPLAIPTYPDWDLAKWAVVQEQLTDKGLYVNDYINTFWSQNNSLNNDTIVDPAVAAGSYLGAVRADGTTPQGGTPARIKNFQTPTSFHYISKKIQFVRPEWLADYKVNVSFVNCIAPNSGASDVQTPYCGHWVEKGFDEFTIYVAFAQLDYTVMNDIGKNIFGRTVVIQDYDRPYPASFSYTQYSGGKKKKATAITVNNRGTGLFSGFIVPVGDILYSDIDPLTSKGFLGNPRLGKCTYPTVMWSIEGVPVKDNKYLYGNLNQTNPTIVLKDR